MALLEDDQTGLFGPAFERRDEFTSLPDEASDFWVKPSTDLLEFLRSPRTVVEVFQWGKTKRLKKAVVINCLAWLRNRRSASFREGLWFSCLRQP
jgi:hypothetical protein